MTRQRRERGVLASQTGRNLMEEAKARLNWTNFKIASEAKASEKTVIRFLNRTDRIDISNARNIVSALGLNFNDIVPPVEELASQSIETLSKRTDEDQAANLIQGLEDSLTKYVDAEDSESSAMKWLEVNYEEIFDLDDLRIENFKMVSVNPDYEVVNLENLHEEIKKYIELVQYCLDLGSHQLIDSAIEECMMPRTYDANIYVHFLEFIRDNKILGKASSIIAGKILIPLEYLIKVLPIKL